MHRLQLRRTGAVGYPGGDRLMQHRLQLRFGQRRRAAGALTVRRELCEAIWLEGRRLRPVAGDELVTRL